MFHTVLCLVANVTCPISGTDDEAWIFTRFPDIHQNLISFLIQHGVDDLEAVREAFRILANFSYFQNVSEKDTFDEFKMLFEEWINEKFLSALASQLLKVDSDIEVALDCLHFCLGFLMNLSQNAEFGAVLIDNINLKAFFSLILNELVSPGSITSILNTLLQLLCNLSNNANANTDFKSSCKSWILHVKEMEICDPQIVTSLLQRL